MLKGLELGCSGIITATCNVTAKLARKVYDDFYEDKSEIYNEKLCNVRKTFDQFNLISGLHTFMSDQDNIFKKWIFRVKIAKCIIGETGFEPVFCQFCRL